MARELRVFSSPGCTGTELQLLLLEALAMDPHSGPFLRGLALDTARWLADYNTGAAAGPQAHTTPHPDKAAAIVCVNRVLNCIRKHTKGV